MDTFDGYSRLDFEDFHEILKAKFSKRTFSEELAHAGGSAWDKLVNYLYYFPDLLELSIRIVFDDSCPSHKKGELFGAIKYAIYPVDIIPDAIPDAGWVDDLIVVAIALHKFNKMGHEERAAVEEHWDGDLNVAAMIVQLLDVANGAVEFLPRKLMKLVKATLHQGHAE